MSVQFEQSLSRRGIWVDIETQLSDLIDDGDFQSVDVRMARFNIFEAIGAIRGELRHSNFLAFLLSPERSHGLGSEPLLRVLRAILSLVPQERRPIRILELVVGELDGAVVYREQFNIDLLIEIKSLKFVVVIENKIDARAGEGQLLGYRNVIDSHYKGWRQLFVFLTPDGRQPDDPSYAAFSYLDLAKVIEGFLEVAESVLANDTELVLRHYVEMLRRHIVPDEELRNIAQRLYERHKEAFDFIFECRPGVESLLTVAIPLMRSIPEVVEDKHVESMLRFVPKSWVGVPLLNSCDTNSWTKTGRNLLFEIKSFSGPERLIVILVNGPGDGEFRQRLYKAAGSHPDLFRGLVKPMGKQWSTIYSRELLTVTAAQGMTQEQKINAIKSAWLAFAENDLPRLEQSVLDVAAEKS